MAKAVGHDIVNPLIHPGPHSGGETAHLLGGVAKQEAHTYGPLVHGHVGSFGHELEQHPLGPILDALTVATLGAGGVAKAGALASKAGLVSDTSKLATLGKAADLTVPDFGTGESIVVKQTAHQPLAKLRQQAVHAGLNKLPPETPVVGSTARAVRALQRGPAKEAARLDLQAQDAARSFAKLSKPEKVAWHLKARRLTPQTYRGFLATEAKTSPAALRLLADPKVSELVAQPSARLADALTKGRALSERLTASRVQAGHIDELTALEAPYRHLRLVGGAKVGANGLEGGPSVEQLIHEIDAAGGEHPFYVPDTAQVPGVRSRFASRPAGYAAPAQGVKQSRLVLASQGRINFADNALARDYGRYRNQAAAQMLHDELVKHAAILPHGEQLPHGWDYLPLNRGQAAAPYTERVGAALERELQPPTTLERLRQAGQREPVPENTAPGKPAVRLTARQAQKRLAELDAAHQSMLEKIVPEVSPYGGKISQREQLARNHENSRVGKGNRIGASRTPTVKAEELQLAEAKLHDLIASHPDEPTVQRAAALVAERKQLRNLLNAHAEAGIAGETAPEMPIVSPSVPAPHRLIVPKQVRRLVEDESRSYTSRLAQIRRVPLNVWKGLVLGLRPAFFGNITIGNSILGTLQMAPGRFGFVGWLNQVMPGFEKVAGAKLSVETMRDVFPEQAGGTFAGSVAPHGYYGSSRTLRVASKAAQGVAPATIAYENVLRRAMAEGWARANPAVAELMGRNGGDINAALRQVATTSPQTIDNISRRIDNALGNYRTYNRFERGIKAVVPFYGWDRHVTSSLFRLASERPQVLDALLNTGEQGKQQADRILGALSSYLEGSIPAKLPSWLGGQQGATTVLNPTAWNPFSTVIDEGRLAANLAGGKAGAASDTYPLAPDVEALIEQMTGRSLLTGAPIKGNALAQALLNISPQASIITRGKPKPTAVNQNQKLAMLMRLLGLPVENLNLSAAHAAAARERSGR